MNILEDAFNVLPVSVTYVLPDRGSCYTADPLKSAYERHGVQHRETRTAALNINNMVDGFDSRAQREVMGIML